MADDDDVDLLIDSWSDRLESVDLTPLDVMSRLRRAAIALAEVRHDVFKEAGLGDGEFEVLAALRRIDPHGVGPTRLLALVTCDITTLKRRIARLLGRGLVNRESASDGARGTIITLTPAGRTRVDATMANLIAREREMLAPLSTDDMTGLERGLRQLLEGAEQSKKRRLGPER
ncbi:MarR family winged helix-turn-helix transcriptional regulator [Microbacterium sp.]|jgi:DNA-binding MarR family transcriptional regulator|uniref:MarR family winged helix-turn-helix transcriptional regulator n=1 Tax=Microbacterium sp. TaxID=51671 RepID=UPI0035AFF3AB